ncbi:hypothetical protein PanWU01x14_195610, partial [Parasponia andersonii]
AIFYKYSTKIESSPIPIPETKFDPNPFSHNLYGRTVPFPVLATFDETRCIVVPFFRSFLLGCNGDLEAIPVSRPFGRSSTIP